MACLWLPLLGWLTALVASVGGDDRSIRPPDPAPSVLSTQAATAAARCAHCHQDRHRQWESARHARMLQPATPTWVLGDFSRPAVVLRGVRFALARDGDRYTIGGPFPRSEEVTHRVDYTLGSRRVQHYLTTLADGRIVVLPPTWDVARREWFHNLDIVNPDEGTTNPIQVWNKECLGCHVSGGAKRYDPARDRYDTRWTDFGTSCERCHGTGAEHASSYASGRAPAPGASDVVVPSRLSPERSTMVCAQCHSLRDITVPGFAAGADYFDHFTPVLEYGQKPGSDPAYWADGRPRRFSNDAIGFWQSRCYLIGGATCTTCHTDPHEPDIDRNTHLSRSNDGLCTRCHQAIGSDPTRHTRHAAGSPGSSCVGCHMPQTVVSLRSRMPDHTISVPAPENTARHGIPNACSECHQEQGAAWAAGWLEKWYPGGRRRRLAARADAFAAARRRDPSAEALLIAIARDGEEPPLVRANAVGYLRFFQGPRSLAALSSAAVSEHPAIRATAMLGLGESGFPAAEVSPTLIRALADSRRVVRIGAALSLMNVKITRLDGEPGRRFEAAKRDYLTRATLLSDDATALLDIGKFHLLNQNPDASTRALEASLRLDAGLHASRYFLALGRLAQGRIAEARELLSRIPRDDAHGPAAAKILALLPAR